MLTFQEQVEKFSQAEIIVGTGSGLMNMVFAPCGAKVLQLQDPSHIIDYFWNMAAVLGFDYHYFLCDTVDNPGQADADLYVPIDKLKASLDQLLS
jgi:capsular polysaccharide biosynthesis protein